MYHQDRKFLPDSHYEGQAVFDDRLIFETTVEADDSFKVRYGWGSNSFKATKPLTFEKKDARGSTAQIIVNRKRPIKMDAVIRFDVSSWN